MLDKRPSFPPGRALLGALGASALALGLAHFGTDLRAVPRLAAGAAGQPLGSRPSGQELLAWFNADPGAALAALATAVGWLLLGWFTLGATVHALAGLPGAGSALRRRLFTPISALMLPRLVRHSLDVALRTAVVVGIAGGTAGSLGGPPVLAAVATPPGPALGWPSLDRPTGPPPSAVPVDPGSALWSPAGQLPTGADQSTPPVELANTSGTATPSAGAAPATGGAAAPGDRLMVAPGDTLWGIAAAELGPAATDAQIAARWPDWYAANRDALGADPNLILPGQWLNRPGPVPTPTGGS